MCAGVYSKLKAFNVKRWPTYTANVGFSTSQPHALKREIYLMMSWAREVESGTKEASRPKEERARKGNDGEGERGRNGPQTHTHGHVHTNTHTLKSIRGGRLQEAVISVSLSRGCFNLAINLY